MSELVETVYGIDLGTTYSCIARMDEYGRPETIPNAEGARVTPSVVFFESDNHVIVGQEAKNNLRLYADQVKDMIKREMGHSEYRFPYNNTSPEEISSYILKKLVGDAEQFLGTKITDVVITCPAYFGINEREATAKAGEIAGLNVRSIINEPTAAAIAYGLHQETDQTVLIYDLGGGTFDVTIIEIKTGEINVVATGGDHFLGGRNWDELVVAYVAEELKNLTGSTEDPLDNVDTAQDLFLRAEDAKKALSNPAREKTTISIPFAGKLEKVILTREKFDELTANLLERTIGYTKQTIKEAADKGYGHIDQILLVGGSTRMLQVPERLRSEFNMEPKVFDPDEAVAKGAAWYGQKLAIGDAIKIIIEGWGKNAEKADGFTMQQAEQEVADQLGLKKEEVQHASRMKIRNVTSHSFGVIAMDLNTDQEVVSNIILKNTTVPTSAQQTFGTYEDYQENAEIRIVENSFSDKKVSPENSEQVGVAMLPLPSGLHKGSPIEITFELDEQGRLHATACEKTQGRSIEVEIQTTRVISEEEKEEARSRVQKIAVS